MNAALPQIIYRQYGGKASLASWIVSHIPVHRTYLEPFCGSCAVLFAKPRSFIEIVNDLDDRIFNLYRKLREEPEKLAALVWATPHAQKGWRDVHENELDDARLFMAQSVQFYCGSGNTSTWAVDKTGVPHKPKSEVWADWFQRIFPAAVRLKGVTLLCEDACESILRVAQQEDAFIYVDPPYWGHEKEYRFRVDYDKMAKILRGAKAKVMISEYPEAEQFFSGWRRIQKETAGRGRTGQNGVSRSSKVKCEVLYCNWGNEEKKKGISVNIHIPLSGAVEVRWS